jgi:hypothetical protein
MSDEMREFLIGEFRKVEAQALEAARSAHSKCERVIFPVFLDGVIDWAIYSTALDKFIALQITMADGEMAPGMFPQPFSQTAVLGASTHVEEIAL